MDAFRPYLFFISTTQLQILSFSTGQFLRTFDLRRLSQDVHLDSVTCLTHRYILLHATKGNRGKSERTHVLTMEDSEINLVEFN